VNADQPISENAPTPEEPRRPAALTLRAAAERPVVTYTIMGITILVFALQFLSENVLGGDLLAALGAKINQAILAGEFWRLITPVLLHGNPLHILVNMYALYGIGRGLERYYGHGRFLALYLLGGFAGNVLSFVLSSAPSLGSSTAIFGLLAAEGVLVYHNRRWFGEQFRPVILNILGIAAVNLFIGFSLRNIGIDNWGHLGGLVGGLLFAWFAGPRWNVSGVYPELRVTDERSSGQILSAFLGVAFVFAAITLVTLFTRLSQP